MKRRRRATTDAARAAAVAENKLERERCDKLVAVLMALPKWEREAWLLWRLDALPFTAIATIVKIPPTEVHAALVDAIQSTQGLLGDGLL